MGEKGDGPCITCQEWRNWGTTSPLLAMVEEIAKELKAMEKDVDAQMSFGGNGGKLQCWLASEDCMCLRVNPCSLWDGMRFWLYMHQEDFLWQNKSGKSLWQVFGVETANLCLFGTAEHEDIMWNSFKRVKVRSGVFILTQKAVSKSVQEAIDERYATEAESLQKMKAKIES